MHAAEDRKNAKVNVRVNVRPLNSNWKPVKCVENSNSTTISPATTSNASPAHKKLDGNVWKTKNVRVEYMEVPPTPPTPESSAETAEAPPTFHPESILEEIPGVIEKCDCGEKNCDIADFKGKKLEMWKEEKSKSHKKRAKKSHKKSSHSKPRVQKVLTSYSVPPNSVATPSSKKRWTKLYEQTCAPSKPLEKLPLLPPGQISISELAPEEPARSPQLLEIPTISPASEDEKEQKEHKKEQKEPKNETLEVQKPSEPVISSEEIIFVPTTLSTTSDSGIIPRGNLFRRAEQLYYGSEVQWWMLVGLVMLTIFAYRSSIEQHTCYYD